MTSAWDNLRIWLAVKILPTWVLRDVVRAEKEIEVLRARVIELESEHDDYGWAMGADL